MNLGDGCRYVGYWGTGNGDMKATKEVVRQKIIEASNLIKCHQRRETIVRPSLQEHLALATVNSKCSLALPENTCW